MTSKTHINPTTTTNNTTGIETFAPPRHWKLILGLYLTGIGMGALDTAIVNPARTVIQHGLGINDQTGVWVFTIYTLAYAAGIPVIGKLADVLGRKPVYLIAIGLFGLGSLGCGLSQTLGSFGMLLASRVVQALGGGGIMPVATAAVTTVVPKAKQGTALGLVGMVYGVTSVLGAGAGSMILGIAGAEQWQWIFYINLPVAAVVLIAGLAVLPRQKTQQTRQLDWLGIVIVVTMITSLLWGFQHLDFARPVATLTADTWVSLGIFLALSPLFWWWETRMERLGKDPLINFKHFATLPMTTTLLIGAIAGFLMMTIMFIPQFAELTMNLPTGAGGYPTIIVGLASAIGAGISGRLTDRLGPRHVIAMGLGISALAGTLLMFWAVPFPGATSTLFSVSTLGLGMGFLMGAPLTYLVLHLVPASEANSGQATLSLVRSIATTVAPAVLVGFLASGARLASGAKTAASSALSLSPAFPPEAQLGFSWMFACYTLVSVIGLVLLLGLPSKSELTPKNSD